MMAWKKNKQPGLRPEYVAGQLLAELNINNHEDLFYLEEIASRRHALVVYETLKGSEARLAVVGNRAFITVSDSVLNPHRRRFSIAHELGHLEMHRYESSLSICQSQDLNKWQTNQSERNLETEANLFAAAFLLPQAFFEPLCFNTNPSLDLISELGRSFKTSLTATALRYIHFSLEPCVIAYSEEGKVRWVIPNSAFKELGVYVESRVRLDTSSLAHKALQRNEQQITGRVALDTWAAPGKYNHHATIQEESWVFNRHNAILTLLWVDEEIYEEDDLWV